MGYGFYIHPDDREGTADGLRAKGYMVIATCDKRGCDTEIDRGLGYVCGDDPHDQFSDEPGCGLYFCEVHRGWRGARGGCSHRQQQAWGQTLSCMNRHDDEYGQVWYCTSRCGHEPPHGDPEGLHWV